MDNFLKHTTENFGELIDQAFGDMLDIALDDNFDFYSPEDFVKLDSVLALLSDIALMWETGKIIIVHDESEDKK